MSAIVHDVTTCVRKKKKLGHRIADFQKLTDRKKRATGLHPCHQGCRTYVPKKMKCEGSFVLRGWQIQCESCENTKEEENNKNNQSWGEERCRTLRWIRWVILVDTVVKDVKLSIRRFFFFSWQIWIISSVVLWLLRTDSRLRIFCVSESMLCDDARTWIDKILTTTKITSKNNGRDITSQSKRDTKWRQTLRLHVLKTHLKFHLRST